MKYRITLSIVFAIILIISFGVISYSIDKKRIDNKYSSIFTIPLLFYKDGGTIYRIGIGYGVFEWKIITIIKKDGYEINGEYIGNEIIPFPKCYQIIGSHNIEPHVSLDLIQYNN